MTKCLDEAKAVGLSAAGLCTDTLAGFRGVTSSLLADASTFGTFLWMKSNFSKLPDFVTMVRDFAALSSATNLSKTLAKSGCEHVESLRRKEFESPAEHGETPKMSQQLKTYKFLLVHVWATGCLRPGRGSSG